MVGVRKKFINKIQHHAYIYKKIPINLIYSINIFTFPRFAFPNFPLVSLELSGLFQPLLPVQMFFLSTFSLQQLQDAASVAC